MKIYTTTTPDFQEACERWLVSSIRSVEPSIDVNIDDFSFITGSTDFQSSAFQLHNLEKNRRLRSWIHENDGQVIFVTDSDIIYVRPFVQRLLEELGSADIALAKEHPCGGYNIGQMVIRCSQGVAEFFERVEGALLKGEWDQHVINSLLASGNLTHRCLPDLFINSLIWTDFPAHLRGDIYSYHANDTAPTGGKSSMQLKQEKIDQVRAELDNFRRPEADPKYITPGSSP